MIEEEEEIPESDFNQTHEAIQDAYTQIYENQHSISEKEVTLVKMKKEYSDRKLLFSQTERDVSILNYELHSEMEQFKNSYPFQLSVIDQTQSEIEEQLKKLEEEKIQLLSKAESLSDKCNSMFSTIQRASEEFKSFGYQSPSKIEMKANKKELEEAKQNINQVINDIEKITDQIMETKSSVIYFDVKIAQTHTFYLRELENTNKIKSQIYYKQVSFLTSVDSQKMDYDKINADQKYQENSLLALKTKIDQLKQNKIMIKEKENQKDSKIQQVKNDILDKKENISKLKNELQIINDELFEIQKEKNRSQNQIINVIQEKKDQINQVQKAKEEMKYLIRKEKRKNNNNEISVQHINNLSIDFQKEEDQIDQESIALDDLESKLKIKEKKSNDENEKIQHDKKVLNQAYSDLKHQIIEQEKIETELKYHEIEPMPTFEMNDKYKGLENKLRSICLENKKKKKQIQTILNKKKNYMKEKTQLLAELTEKTKECLKLEEQYKEERDKYFVFCKKYHRALVVDQSLTSNINNIFQSNKDKKKTNKSKKKVLVRIMGECGVKNMNGDYVINKVEENFEPTKREKRLHHFIEKYKEIIDKVNELKLFVGFNLSPIVHEAILKDWDEFIEKQTKTI